MDVHVLLAPVTVRYLDEQPTMCALRPDGVWATAKVFREPRATARELLLSLEPTDVLRSLPLTLRDLRPVAFAEGSRDNRRVTLIYTVALPMAVAESAPRDGAWLTLTKSFTTEAEARSQGSSAIARDPVAEPILDYWRQALESRAGVLSFLAPYFTLAQVRDVYSAVWGYRQDTATVAKWVNEELADGSRSLREVGRDPELQAAVAQELARHTGNEAELAIGDALKGRHPRSNWTGTSLAAIHSLGPMAAAVIPVSAVALAGSVVAFQRTTRGKPPAWYQRMTDQPYKVQTQRIYGPRPAWEHAPSRPSGRPT